MFAAERKFKKTKEGQEPTELERQVAQSIFELEISNKELKADLQTLRFTAVRELSIKKTDKKALIIFVPLIHFGEVHRAHSRLVSEMEKKYGKHVVIVGQRKAETRRKSKMIVRHYKRTLAAVHEALLSDVAFPVEIVGRRTRVHADGRVSERIFLDPRHEDNYKHKLPTFNRVYKMLTGKKVHFEFPTN